MGVQAAATTATPPTPVPRTDDGVELQGGYVCGAWVYDMSHGGLHRGYGKLREEGNPTKDGKSRWYVDWAVGRRDDGRSCAIQERYLEVALISNDRRRTPTAIGQPVLVVLGTLKGRKGTIVGKVGRVLGGVGQLAAQPPGSALLFLTSHHAHASLLAATLQCGTMWRCKMDGADGMQPFSTDYLHATAPPPPDAPIFTATEPITLVEALGTEQIPSYLENLQFDADNPIDLRRIKPDSELWFDVLTGGQDMSDLSDADLCYLHYEAAGAWRREDRAGKGTWDCSTGWLA